MRVLDLKQEVAPATPARDPHALAHLRSLDGLEARRYEVALRGLTTNQELNGRRGVVRQAVVQNKPGRVGVEVQKKIVAVPIEKLKLVKPSALGREDPLVRRP